MQDKLRRARVVLQQNILVIALVSFVPSLLAAAHPVLQSGAYELHPDFELSLFAAEPDVVDPVALTFDEQGRVFVVEMRDYPNGIDGKGKVGGTIRFLEDTNGDGKADRSVVFAENLSFPTSIAPWKGGVIVTAPPEIIYLLDTDGDGRADRREVLLSGFHLGVTDSNVNGLRWGLDNRLHGVNGGNDGFITSHRHPGAAAISIRKLDFSFDPESGDFSTTTHTSGGFGLVFDDWGHSFSTYNINHIQQRILPFRYLQRFPGLPPVEGIASISDHDDMARIFPVSEPETRPNHPEQSGHFSAAGGMGLAAVAGLPGDVSKSVFVCDVVGHVVHRDVLVDDGPIFLAKRSATERTNEFFAARDPALRPVGMELGPDGAFYLLDMQRDVIEHPDYIPARTMTNLDVRAGHDRGRIYRLKPKNAGQPRPPNLYALSSPQLVDLLGHSNQWWRMTAQRLLVERRDTNTLPSLKARLASTNPRERLHVLWTIHGLQRLDESLLGPALRDPNPGVRENALILSESFLRNSAALQEQVRNLTEDPVTRVRFQAALSIGYAERVPAERVLGALLRRDYRYRWMRLAVLSSLRDGETQVLTTLLEDGAFLKDLDPSKAATLRELADLCAARASEGAYLQVLGRLAALPDKLKSQWALPVLEGLSEGSQRIPITRPPGEAVSNSLQPFLTTASAPVLAAAWRLSRGLQIPDGAVQRAALTRAIRLATNPSLPFRERIEQIQLLAFGDFETAGEALLNLLAGPELVEVQSATVMAMRGFTNVALARGLIARWRSLQPSVRPMVLNLLLQRATFHEPLIAALEAGRVTLGELNLDLEQRRRLLRKSSPELTARAAKLMGDGEYSNRSRLVEEWLKKLPTNGDEKRGRQSFVKLCASCHSAEGTARSVGPNLASVAHRSVEDLVSNILDPNMAINPSYVAYTVETRQGEVWTGVLQTESANEVVLLQAMGMRAVIQRKDVQEMHSTGLSLMPEGLEAGLSPSELRDLVAYLQSLR
jgi:putative membrane-bound dehydrogenase-like protein